ncbi:phosphohistidine phosphatase SixA [Pseudoteredinibacter isoporae]|uniref:Phosphohistidine phosphatase SixA n=1 Tax=Pseudoteredinibacter isoporae TaxID=570281 RepID=A0A7X0JXK8_9GAMM|nr:phosphohistidine phosphatase SixA [Pseudoteredinibacter isoporae]MBB6523375.1 phosphohistidine phosphatase SixA [Pseudoteredinibacter isoporae]NHO88887.1 phosphohistidine phosphatase SixA [Pseudoteredinibacter isoporae]NIB24405.1 phosphohistidine phosphatase SixA [Pseudoteredinibacter isoporae]
MRLFILRHGQASYQAPSDAERELTERGRLETEIIIREHLVQLNHPPVIVSSPYVRAQQTAQIAAEQLGLASQSIEAIKRAPWQELRSESSPERTITRIGEWFEHNPGRDLLCVSHQPLVGQLINILADLIPGRHMMGTSALACLEGEDCLPACMDLLALHQP